LDSVASFMQSLYVMVNHLAHRFHDTQSIRTEVIVIYFIYSYHT
jgi:hypothetical protein